MLGRGNVYAAIRFMVKLLVNNDIIGADIGVVVHYAGVLSRQNQSGRKVPAAEISATLPAA